MRIRISPSRVNPLEGKAASYPYCLPGKTIMIELLLNMLMHWIPRVLLSTFIACLSRSLFYLMLIPLFYPIQIGTMFTCRRRIRILVHIHLKGGSWSYSIGDQICSLFLLFMLLLIVYYIHIGYWIGRGSQ